MTTKRFLKIQLIIVIMLTFALVCNTYSWSTRPAVTGGGFMSESNVDGSETHEKDKSRFTAFSLDTSANSYFVNGNSCTGATYAGTKDAEGTVTYDTTAITKVSSQSVTADTVLYFRTNITNGAAVTTNTSLFIDVKYGSALEGKYFIGVTTPTKDLMTYSAGTTTATRTVRWIPVVAQYEITASGTAYIDWYVKFEGAGSFEITNIVLTNN